MILETIEPYLEVINLVLAIVIVGLAIFVSTRLAGTLKRAWSYMTGAIVLFGIHEIVGSLTEFGIINVEGLYALTEFVYIVALLLAIFAFKGIIAGLSGGKKR